MVKKLKSISHTQNYVKERELKSSVYLRTFIDAVNR